MTLARDIAWSKAEKAVARRAFDLAYRRECEAIRGHVNGFLSDSAAPEDVWRVHDFLTEQRREVAEKYDSRYSVLIVVFARLMREGWLRASDLDGLHAEQVSRIVALANT